MEVVELIERPSEHHWSVLTIKSGLDESCAFFSEMIQEVKDVYGETSIISMAEDIEAADMKISFDQSKIKNALKMGLPDPSVETSKPKQLTNYRSEAAELLARKALVASYNILFPVAAQTVKGNANQPILGFDGWGILKYVDGSFGLVLVQVKGSDENKSPPKVIQELLEESRNARFQKSTMVRALVTLAHLIKDEELKSVLLKMLEEIGDDKLPSIVVAPVLIRGKLESSLDDIVDLIDGALDYEPAKSRGATASIGQCLSDFGFELFTKARS